jgi:ribonuclease P protein component
VNRNFRLKNSVDFMRVRRFGRSYAHPLIVLVALPMSANNIRIGIIAGRSLGNAVQRNHVKRMVRETLRTLLPSIKPGWDVIIICRRPILEANFTQIQETLSKLFFKAELTDRTYSS